MVQEVYGVFSTGLERLELPDPDQEVMPGIRWDAADVLFTPAYWAAQAWLDKEDHRYRNNRLGQTLKEEVAACLLGGFGIPAEVGLAAFAQIRAAGMLDRNVPPTEEEVFGTLVKPLRLGGRRVRYRFARQRARYLASALRVLEEPIPEGLTDRALRNWLMERLPGVGAKTASWITRNWRQSNHVAIIDIHIFRAGLLVNLFSRSDCAAKHYLALESRFLEFAAAIRVPASALDTLIWRQMKEAGRLALRLVHQSRPTLSHLY